MKLLGDGRTADDAAAFEHEHLEAGFREVGGAHETVVAGADQDRVVVLRGHETDYAVPPSSRRRPGSSFLGRQEIWIPAFAGMTRSGLRRDDEGCVRSSASRTNARNPVENRQRHPLRDAA